MSRNLKRVAIFIVTLGGLLSLALSLIALNEMWGDWGVVLGLVLFPLTWAYFPLYALFASGSWYLFLLTYGSLALSWYLVEVANNMEMPVRGKYKEPITKPVVMRAILTPGVILLVIGLILVAVLMALSPLFAAIWTPERSTVAETEIPLPTSTLTPTFLSIRACVTDSAIHIRRGPGTQYESIGGMVSGTCMWVLSRNPESSWVYIATEDNMAGWVAVSLLTIDGDVTRLSVRGVSEDGAVTPTPTPSLSG